EEALPPTLPSASEQQPLYNGETRLYMSYICPYAQRAWIARNYKLPSLEHNNKIIGESLDLIKYIDSNFAGPKLTPDDPEKQRLGEELLAYSDSFHQAMCSALISKGNVTAEAVAALDDIECSLSKFDDGPFFLGQFSLVDIAYAPFIDGFQTLFAGIKNCNITEGSANIQIFIEEMNKIDAYTQTKQDPSEVIAPTKKKLGII
uniref:GST N-terminal domain-containing protein n=1 Tax=Oryza brachyantha TaxID=4533 RepID=J3LMM0_ORYBR